MAGGLITLVVTLIEVRSWLGMYATNGLAFGYSQWLVVASINLSAMGGLVLLFVGLGCAIVILVGGVMQYSGTKTKVRRGSILVLISTIIGIPATSFGWLLGGLLSTLGAYFGLVWKSLDETEGL